MGVAGANIQWGDFVCPSSRQKRESTAFDLILRSAWVGDFRVLVSKTHITVLLHQCIVLLVLLYYIVLYYCSTV